jgi:hypothetical protein
MIKQVNFSANDLKVIKETAFTKWPENGFPNREAFENWLRKTHINLALKPYLWGLIGARYPNRFMCYWDLVDVFDCMQLRPGRIYERCWEPGSKNPTPQMIVEATESVLRQAKAEMTISSLTCVLSTYDDSNALEQLWAYVDTVEKLVSNNVTMRIPTLIATELDEAPKHCLWVTKQPT